MSAHSYRAKPTDHRAHEPSSKSTTPPSALGNTDLRELIQLHTPESDALNHVIDLPEAETVLDSVARDMATSERESDPLAWSEIPENETTTAAERTPVIDQHGLDHERNWAFCGIATLIGILEGEGKEVNHETRAELEQLASGIYVKGSGTSGSGMAERMRRKGLEANFTTNGSMTDLVRSLDKGSAVPMGVVSLEGTVSEIPGGKSNQYPGLQTGEGHARTFSSSGHWVTVVGYEGDAKNPTTFIVNDPDTGAQLKLSAEQLQRSAAANNGEGIWMVER